MNHINKVTVVNIEVLSDYNYCGRNSPLGNPYEMTNHSDEERDRVCDLYETYFIKVVQCSKTHPFNIRLNALVSAAKRGPIKLGCHCAPKRCHCDTIKKYIDNQLVLEKKYNLSDLKEAYFRGYFVDNVCLVRQRSIHVDKLFDDYMKGRKS